MKQPFVLTKRKIIVSAEIKGIVKERSFDFILDIGASKSIIDSRVACALGFDLQKLENEKLMTVSGKTNSKTLNLPKICLFGKNMVDFEVNVMDIPVQILFFADGLIGMDFLLQFKNMKFDLVQKIIET